MCVCVCGGEVVVMGLLCVGVLRGRSGSGRQYLRPITLAAERLRDSHWGRKQSFCLCHSSALSAVAVRGAEAQPVPAESTSRPLSMVLPAELGQGP